MGCPLVRAPLLASILGLLRKLPNIFIVHSDCHENCANIMVQIIVQVPFRYACPPFGEQRGRPTTTPGALKGSAYLDFGLYCITDVVRKQSPISCGLQLVRP